MAGVNPSAGTPAGTQEVPAIGGAQYRSSIGIPATSPNAAGGHVGDAMRAEGVAYDSNCSVGEKLDTGGYPAGTSFPDSTPEEGVN